MWVNTTVQEKFFSKLLTRPDNIKCADCNSKSPTWASIDFGVLICLNCSGAHRALGPSITRVKSTKLDTWMSDWFDLMTIGNETCNRFWQANLGMNKKPNNNSSLDQIKQYVTLKYIKKKYAIPGQKDPVTLLKSGVKPEAIKQQKATKQVVKEDIDNVSHESNPDGVADNLLDFDQEPVMPPAPTVHSKGSTSNDKNGFDLMDFTQPAIKKSHSLEPVHHPVQQAMAQPQGYQLTNSVGLPYGNHVAYNHHNAYAQHPVIHTNNHFGMFQQGLHHVQAYNHLPAYQQTTSFSMNPTQPLNMNINMYAHNINFNLAQEPLLKVTDPEKPKAKDAFADFNEFKF